MTDEIAEGDFEPEPLTLTEYEQAIVVALEAIGQIANQLKHSLNRLDERSRFFAIMSQLNKVEMITTSFATRLAQHFNIDLLWRPSAERAPLAIGIDHPLEVQFVERLANAIPRVSPSGFEVLVSAGELWFRGPRGAATPISILDDLGRTGLADDGYVLAATKTLDRFDQFVKQFGTEPWIGPATAHAEVVDQHLRMWFSDSEGIVVLRLDDIPRST